MQHWLATHPIVSYLLIFAFVTYVFNRVFRVKKLPILKEIAIYIVMAIGCFMLLIFQIDKLPIIQCLFVAVVLMFMVRIRYFVEERRKKQEQKQG
ncbi:YlaH-like family protein [Paenibacillus sp. ACRRX]|uniref:YlaH-like family protein n=1 Tax=unclassified Paenibacillus TaxID=185978 RepID=UPI001EF6CB35|nr:MULTISPECIES: YlaH-like family protein [unclassified Paenibacillus]MCG7407822.1 YlaH-like family protein [Paenibacillus sp. ACRRX]MDK8180965.1 YlaH-like family protein [Paenibacillus sp. UMB4589-SE434]